MNKITKENIKYSGANLEIGNGLVIRIKTEHDQTHSAPWKECDGHGPVSEWTTRDKGPGERIISTDRRSHRFYDFAEAVKIAKRDGWGLTPEKLTALAAKQTHLLTTGEIAVASVEADFEFLRGWCADEWQYIAITVSLENGDGQELASDSLGGVESFGNYWKEQAAEMANTLIEANEKENTERAHWEARDVETV